MDKKDYTYEDNMHVIDEIINELILVRTVQEIENFETAKMNLMLQMFPCVSEQGDIIEGMFDKYIEENTIKEWYESLFKIPIIKN